MAKLNPITKTVKSLNQLGLSKMSQFGLYQLGLRTGHYRRLTPSERSGPVSAPTLPPLAQIPAIPPA